MTSGPEARELRARFGVPESVKLGVNDWGWLRILAAAKAKQKKRGKGQAKELS